MGFCARGPRGGADEWYYTSHDVIIFKLHLLYAPFCLSGQALSPQFSAFGQLDVLRHQLTGARRCRHQLNRCCTCGATKQTFVFAQRGQHDVQSETAHSRDVMESCCATCLTRNFGQTVITTRGTNRFFFSSKAAQKL